MLGSRRGQFKGGHCFQGNRKINIQPPLLCDGISDELGGGALVEDDTHGAGDEVTLADSVASVDTVFTTDETEVWESVE